MEPKPGNPMEVQGVLNLAAARGPGENLYLLPLMLYHLGSEFSGFDLTAMLDDAKIGINHAAAWDKIALVSDHEIINTTAKFFG